MSTIEAPRSRRIFLRLVPIWAGLNWLIGGILAVLAGPIVVAPILVGPGESVKRILFLIPAILASRLYLWWSLSWNAEALACARQSAQFSYLKRHWRKALSTVGWALGLNLLFAGGFAVSAWLAVFARGSASDAALLWATICGVAFLLLMGDVGGMLETLKYVRIVPYFESSVGDIDTFCRGGSLARWMDELDALARSRGIHPLSEFGWNDDFAWERLIWHDPGKGLMTVNALLELLRAGGEIGGADRAGVIDDLERIADALAKAGARKTRFCLLLRHGNVTSGLEWEKRRGTCF